jgi:demethylmenaquinone methyltransferase/2-methoxy-6-polyprenyl-1,4-benzoquinol methylase
MAFTVGVAQDLGLPDVSFDVVTCTLAMHHIPVRQRQSAFAEMYRVTRPGGRLLTADMAPLLHSGGRRESGAAAAADSLRDLAAAAGYDVESAGKLPLLRYIVAVRPQESRG